MKLFDRFTNVLEKIGDKISSITYISIIKDAFVAAISLVIIGSFATLINNVFCSTKNGIAQFSQFAFLSEFSPIFNSIYFATMNLLSIFIVFLVASNLSKVRKVDGNMAGLIALASYIILIPLAVSGKSAGGEVVTINNVISSTYTGPQGLFLAIIVGILSTELFCKLQKVEKLQVKMPDSVPIGVSKSFNVLFPGMITLLVISVFGYTFQKISGSYVTDIIYTMFQKPMEAAMQYPLGFLVLVLLCQGFWIIGIHGTSMIKVVREPIALAAIAANLAAYEAGNRMENIFTIPFWNVFVTIGGCGNTIGLIIAIFIFSKREDYRAIAKLSIIPSFFGINEPMIFGLPIVLNPIMAIPFVLAPVVSSLIGYYATMIGFAGVTMIQIPFTVPPLLNAFLASGGSIGLVITQFIAIIVSTLIYIPFVRISNKQAQQA